MFNLFEFKQILANKGFMPSKFLLCLFIHTIRDIIFSLVVENFCVKDTKEEDAEHLSETIKSRYEGQASWEPNYYFRIGL